VPEIIKEKSMGKIKACHDIFLLLFFSSFSFFAAKVF
jgi:hypothetical protein